MNSVQLVLDASGAPGLSQLKTPSASSTPPTDRATGASLPRVRLARGSPEATSRPAISTGCQGNGRAYRSPPKKGPKPLLNGCRRGQIVELGKRSVEQMSTWPVILGGAAVGSPHHVGELVTQRVVTLTSSGRSRASVGPRWTPRTVRRRGGIAAGRGGPTDPGSG